MASSFETAFAAQFNPSALVQFAEAVTYTPAGATAKSVQCVVLRESRSRIFDESGAFRREEIEVYVSTADVTTPIDVAAASGSGVDALSIDSTTFYAVEVVERTVAGWHRLRCATKVFVG
jgi:hypothetical protein